MPVILEVFRADQALSGADHQDLERLRADHPAPGDTAQQRWQKGQWLVAGRFNDRILSAAWVEDQHPWWRIDDLCVRKMTRRRGVARQLLTLLIRQAEQAGRGLILAADEAAEVMAPLLQQLGFVRTELPDHAPTWNRPVS